MDDDGRLLRLRARVGRQLLLVVAAVALFGTGGVDLLLRPLAASAALAVSPAVAGSAVGRTLLPSSRTAPSAPLAPNALRFGLGAPAPGSQGSADGPLAGPDLLAAPHPVAQPPVGHHDVVSTGGAAGAAGSRAPPSMTGTDVTLPPRP